jgi:pimeloyl-ACP methyl ester carboxylesterase
VNYLKQRLGSRYEVLAPEHYGCESTGPWTGAHAFRLADEAEKVIAIIDGGKEKVHLVGHSYGGGVAMNVALARGSRIASLALYERRRSTSGGRCDAGAAAFAEIAAVSRKTGEGVMTGDYTGAAASFIDYWSGPGAWTRLQPWVRAALVRSVSKVPLEFHALMEEPTPSAVYTGLSMPMLILRGEHAPRPTRMIAERLSTVLPDVRSAVIAGASHMGPLTHPAPVNDLIVDHIDAAEAAIQLSRDCNDSAAADPGFIASLPFSREAS